MFRRIAPSAVPAPAVALAALAGMLLVSLPVGARVELARYPTDVYTEARTAALDGRLDRADTLWQQMLGSLDGPLYAVDLATACGETSVREILDQLREVHPVFTVRDGEADGTPCRRILFGLFPAEQGMEPLVRHLPAVSLYPPTLVRLEELAGAGLAVREVRQLTVQPAGPTHETAQPASGLSEEELARAEALFAEGTTKLQAQDLPGAEAAFRAVLEIQPDNISAVHNLGIVRMYQDDYDEGIALFERTIREDPTYLKAYLNLATAYFGKGQPRDALEVLNRARVLVPDSFEVRYTLAAVSAEIGALESAWEHLEVALALRPDDPRARALSLALPPRDTLPAPGGEAPAPRRAAAQPAAEPSQPTTGEAEAAGGAPPLGTKLREPTLQIRPRAGAPRKTAAKLPEESPTRLVDREAQEHFQRGAQAYDVGHLRDAEHHFRKAAEIDPANPNILNNLGAVYMDQSRWPEAAEAFRGALSADPEHVKARVNLGGVLYNMGQRDAALQILAEAEALAPTDPEVLYALALLHAHSGNRSAAQEFVSRGVRVAPFDAKMRALEEALVSGNERKYVAEPEIFLRQDPDRNASVVGKIQYGEALQVLQRRSGWTRVRVAGNGMEGWVVDGMLMDHAPTS